MTSTEKIHRRSIRLNGYDYSGAGAYFVTICTRDRECLFGDVVNGEVRLNDLGSMVEQEWLQTPGLRPQVELDAYVVMPNHFHAILLIEDSRRGVLQYAPTNNKGALRSPSQTVGAMVRGFKSSATKRINEIRKTPALPVWQRNYYEHIIRDKGDLNKIREYIIHNPTQWAQDEENPVNIKPETIIKVDSNVTNPWRGNAVQY